MWRVELWPGFGRSFYGITNGYGVWRRAGDFVYLTKNYAEAAKALDLPLLDQPELLEDPVNAAKASIWYWQWRVRPNVRNMYDVKEVTRQINPKLKGLEDRLYKFDAYKHLRVNR